MKNSVELKWKSEKGKSFENLVSELLKCMFPDLTFKQTDYVHDGGKDFYSIGNMLDETIWIEAKNYQSHLELSKFSNTFIMADISEINRIIIFSMSEVTKGARRNIGRYASYHNKTISVYSGDEVLFLIKKYREYITLDNYIENIEELFSILEKSSEPCNELSATTEYYRAKQFNLAYRRNKDSYIKVNEMSNLPLNSLIAQEIHITNHDMFCSKDVVLDYAEYDASYFETYFHKQRENHMIIPPASTTVIVIFFKIVDIFGNVKLPTINFDSSEIIINNSPCQLECCWLGEIPYMGKAWVELQNTIGLIENDHSKKIILIEGKSGVGKSRFLEEIAGFFFRKGCRIISLDFRSIKNISLKSVLQYILNNIYVLDDTNYKSELFIDEFGKLYKDFYDIIFNDSYDCNAHIDRISLLLHVLFARKKIVLLIDNVQDVSSEAIDFFEKLLKNMHNDFDTRTNIILCFNQDFLYQENRAYKLLSYSKQLNTSHTVELRDFGEDDARLYLRENLDPQGLRLDLFIYYDEIIKRFGTNPFVLKQLILYLKQRGIIAFAESTIYISDFNNMKIVLSELPRGIENILQYRYAHLCCNLKLKDSKDLDRLIWTILFLGELKEHWISKFRLDTRAVRALADYGFIEYNEKSEIVFCHQLIEKSFCLLFSSEKYDERPFLNFIDDEEFLERLFSVTNRIGKINLSIENMLLRAYLNKTDIDNFSLAVKKLINYSPRPIMLPLIINTITDCLNEGLQPNPQIELKALYSISMVCQEKFDVNCAAEYTADLVRFEQETYKQKLSAKDELITFFKNYVFQLPIAKKYVFLDWFIKEAVNFELVNEEFELLMCWIHNRYSKNLCSEHNFIKAENHVQSALNIALEKKDFLSAAQAEIEYGNIFAYKNLNETVMHWSNCVKYISKYNNVSIYFKIYMYGYDILCKLLDCQISDDMHTQIELLLEMRQETFLYQQLFIDDIYANYYIIQYLDDNCSFEEFKRILPKMIQMKADSYMHTSKFTILATYKLFTIYRLICNKEPTTYNKDITISYAYELINSGIFSDSKLEYSGFILFEIHSFCRNDCEVYSCIKNKLPDVAQKQFLRMGQKEYTEKYSKAVTPLSNKNRQVNLLHFNYVF